MRLRITAPANRDIDELYKYGRDMHGESRADQYLTGLLDDLEYIAANPLLAREREEADPPVRLHVFAGHNIIYDVTADEVVILRILHHSANWIDEL